MNPRSLHVTIDLFTKDETYPKNLLLEADPNETLVEEYVNSGSLFLCKNDDLVVGCYVLKEVGEHIFEIMNVVVAEEFRGRGFGSGMIQHAKKVAEDRGGFVLHIATADTSRKQQRLYRRMGFQQTKVLKNFFIENYPEPIFENGKQCTDKLVFSLQLSFCCSTRR